MKKRTNCVEVTNGILNFAIHKEFKAAGISFPTPLRDVIVHQVCEKAPESGIHSEEEQSRLIK